MKDPRVAFYVKVYYLRQKFGNFLENQKEEEDSDIIQRIKHILDDEIRPAVAMDGGDVQFKSFDNGILTLQLQGACSSCPSATFTLKMGIENRLKEDIPEIVSVVQDGVPDLF